jgi:hypothetical protein
MHSVVHECWLINGDTKSCAEREALRRADGKFWLSGLAVLSSCYYPVGAYKALREYGQAWTPRPTEYPGRSGELTHHNAMTWPTSWTVWVLNPVGGEIFRTFPDGPCGPSSLLYNGYRVFPGGNERPEGDVDPHSLLVPWSRKGRAITLLRLWAVRPVQSLSACTRVSFTFFIHTYIYIHTRARTHKYIVSNVSQHLK